MTAEAPFCSPASAAQSLALLVAGGQELSIVAMGCNLARVVPMGEYMAGSLCREPDEPPPGALDAPRFPERILDANAYVEREYQAMVAIHHRLKALAHAQEATLEAYGAPLIRDCKAIHDDLSSLALRQPVCKEAQENLLPKLFERKALTGKPIDGCAIARPSGPTVLKPCECTSGNMATGCRDAEDDSDHLLLCTHIRENMLGRHELHKLFAPGQACSIDEKASFNEDLLPTDEPTEFKMPGVSDPAMSCSPVIVAWLPPLDASRASLRFGNGTCARGATARSFL